MTREEILRIVEKITLGTATEDEIIKYNRMCEFIESNEENKTIFSGHEFGEIGDSLKQSIIQKTASKTSSLKWMKWTFIAASVLLCVVTLLFTKKSANRSPIQAVERVSHADFVIRHEINVTGKEKTINLRDGSVIVLADKSEITYREPFAAIREITLTGKAFFKVAKDKTRPFIVTSREISTTALGTEFTVTAFENAHQIIVRLYEGKVVVKAVDKSNQRMKKDVYLLPGQQFIYGNKATAEVKAFNMKTIGPEQIMQAEVARDNPAIPENVRRPFFMFNNQPLETVFNNLAALYNVKIIYNKQDVQKAYFTGKYDRSESLKTILNRIGALNNLTITRTDTAYIINK